MRIIGFIHQSEQEAFLGNVLIVPNIEFTCGRIVGYMDISDRNETVIVKQHPGGGLVGQILIEKEINNI